MINLNFLPFANQQIQINVYRKLLTSDPLPDTLCHTFKDEPERCYEIRFREAEGFDPYAVSGFYNTRLFALAICDRLRSGLPADSFFIKRDDFRNTQIHFVLQEHHKGKQCVSLQPYYLKSKNLWGVLVDYHFVVATENGIPKYKLDKEILIASGTLNSRGASNVDYYQFKHDHLQHFIKRFLPSVNEALGWQLTSNLLAVDSRQLGAKTYSFGNHQTSASSYLGLTKNPPLHRPDENTQFYFIYRKDHRDIAVALLKGLRGETSPSTFGGMEKLFRIRFANELIKGKAIDEFNDTVIDEEIRIIREIAGNVIPIIITNARKDEEDDRLYFWLKHKFTNAGLPCQVVTRDLVQNEYSLKYSLSNIGLQIFAKAGGQPWKMKSASTEYLILGIGQSYNVDQKATDNKIEKNITYSVLTDSSGLFKDIQVLGEGVEDDDYYDKLVANISTIINNSGYKKVSIHSPFRMSKAKILDKVVQRIAPDAELSVLVINNKSDFFGFDYANNGLVPFESTYIKISQNEFLVWFEGMQYNNPKITKRFGNPLLIKFWYTNRQPLFQDYTYKESLLQDCINLSGANWRGFRAKQLPVSVFYCQRIAEFISKFKEYQLEHIEISNLKPWFL
jgi:hypothetical protein